MTNYRRNRVPGGTYFFTVAIADRRCDLLARHAEHFKAVFREEQQRAFFINLALALLPDHLHAVWQLPEGDSDYSSRWRRIKAGFTRLFPSGERVSSSRAARGERGIWQRRFWEHTIQDQDDLQRHLDYVHWNPVKHGLVSQVVDWPHSTFHAYVERGIYPADWGGRDIGGDFGE
ncbi:MAG: transposase [Proteobacteria bacterium]|nr:transposase [Desulfobulbaceae bacterium]MBU4154049.1 transposase [Pseudomonadota bacterium]MDP2104574.1 transposase [Desulfobulbaceae bacterium]